MTNSEIGELLAELSAIGTDDPTPPVIHPSVPLSPNDLAAIAELEAYFRGDPATVPVPKIVAGARQIETDFPQASKANGAVHPQEGQCAIPPPSHTPASPTPAHQHEQDEQQNDQSTTNAIPTESPTTTRQTKCTVQTPTTRPASSGAGKRPATRKPRKAAARVTEVATKKTWEGTKSLGRTDRLTNAEKFAFGVSQAASVSGVRVSLNLGIGREGMLKNNDDPKRSMMKHLNKHLGAAGFGHVPYALAFELTPEDEGERLHVHGAIDTSGLSKDDIKRLGMALRRAASFAEGALGGQRQVHMRSIPDPVGWADYCIKATSRLELELGIDDPFMINNPMRRCARQHFEQLQDEVQDLHHAHKVMRLQRRRDLKQQTSHRHVFTLRSPRGMVGHSGARDKKHVGGAAQRAPHRLQTRTSTMTRSPKASALMATPGKRGTA